MTVLQACPRVIAPSRRAQGRERILVLPRSFALLRWQSLPFVEVPGLSDVFQFD